MHSLAFGEQFKNVNCHTHTHTHIITAEKNPSHEDMNEQVINAYPYNYL